MSKRPNPLLERLAKEKREREELEKAKAAYPYNPEPHVQQEEKVVKAFEQMGVQQDEPIRQMQNVSDSEDSGHVMIEQDAYVEADIEMPEQDFSRVQLSFDRSTKFEFVAHGDQIHVFAVSDGQTPIKAQLFA